VRNDRTEPASPDFAPVRIDIVELSAPLPSLGREGPEGRSYASSLCLVRLHGRPLGLIEVELPQQGVSADELAARIRSELSSEVSAHLAADGLEDAPVEAAGLAGEGLPACRAEREQLLARAPSVSVIICTRGRPESVPQTLRSILGSSYPDGRCELIVVDNASSGEPAVHLAAGELGETRFEIRLLREPEPGLAHARNTGLAAASGEIVVFADDDVEVDAEWLAALIAPFERDERVGATSGMTLPGALETPVQRWVEGFGGRDRGHHPRIYDVDDPPPDQPLFPFTPGDLGAGRNMAFRRELLAELGGFDPLLGPPGTLVVDASDIDALLRVLLAGRKVVHEPAAIVWHAHPAEYAELERRVYGYGAGLSACLTKTVVENPRLLPALLRRLPRGIHLAISPGSAKNVGRQDDFPRTLARRELRGFAGGPIAYARARVRSRRRPRTPSPPDLGSAPGRLRLLFVTDEYRPYIGGAGRCIELFARELAGLGHSVMIATAWHPEAPAFEEDGGIQIHRVRDLPSRMRWISEDPWRHTPPPFPDPEAIWRLRRLVNRFQPDLVPAYGWLAHSAAVALAGKRVPMILWGHEYGNTCAVRNLIRHGDGICSGPGPAKCLACSTATRGAAKGTVAALSVLGVRPLLRQKTTAVHGVSHYVTQVMDRDLRFDPARSVVIPNFHEEEGDQPADPAFLDRLPAEPYILFVGAFRRVKGMDVLFDAYARLSDPPPLVLAGIKRPDQPERIPEGLTVLTDVPHATVMAMWERALYGVFPSTWPEPLATVVHEAMSRGRPVIATRTGGHVDMVADGETGLLVPVEDPQGLADAMDRLNRDPALRERLGSAAKARAERFTRGHAVPELERFYRETVAGYRERSR